MDSTVTPWAAIVSASSPGVARSMSRAQAPARSGNSSRPPSPKVKPSGGVPVNTSSGRGLMRWREKVSAVARMSRWKCMVTFGCPVVPEVGASMATSSAAVLTAVNRPSLAAQRAVMSSGPPYRTVVSAGTAAARSAAKR